MYIVARSRCSGHVYMCLGHSGRLGAIVYCMYGESATHIKAGGTGLTSLLCEPIKATAMFGG